MSDSVMYRPVLQRHQHEALSRDKEEIRLMILESGKQSDPLSCKIEHVVDWEDGEIEYEALSYYWGPQDNPYDLICNGCTLPIGQNLKFALLRLRSEEFDRILWTDQICIDQSNAAEQGAQVKLMARIYSCATKVIVWLGEEDEETAPALELITSVARTFFLDLVDEGLDQTVRGVAMEQKVMNATDIWTEFGLPPQDNIAWNRVENLLNRPWFTRAWTYQEIIVAGDSAEILCGSHLMKWWSTLFWFGASLATIVSVLKRRDAKSRPPKLIQQIEYLRQINLARGHYNQLRNKISLSEEVEVVTSLSFQLKDRRSCHATNPKDRVFSLLNIVNDNPSFTEGNQFATLFPQPNYETSLLQVYKNAARYCLYSDRNLDMLYDVESPKHDPTFPSWVPDWRVNWQGTIRGSHSRIGKECTASRGLPAIFWQESQNSENPPNSTTAEEDDSILQVMGIRLSIVEKIEPDLTMEYVNSAGKTVSKMGPSFWRILRMCGEPDFGARKFAFIHDLTRAFVTILTEDNGFIFLALLKRLEQHWSPTSLMLRDHDRFFAEYGDRQIDELAIPLARELKDVRVFETNHEDLCIGPKTIQIGDHVSVLLGGSRPFVLRQTSDAAHVTYALVGECYTPRAISGEGVRVKSKVFEPEIARDPGISIENWTDRMRKDPEIINDLERIRII